MIIVVGLLTVVLVFALLSPMDSLRWWERRGQTKRATHAPANSPDRLPRPVDAQRFAVYLQGIGAVDGVTDSSWERATLKELATELPEVAFSADVFAYAPDNRGLTQRETSWFWGRLADWQRYSRSKIRIAVSYLINMRNAFRVLVSADPRYGPTYNLAVTEQIIESLDRHGYDWEKRPEVVVIGYSGGGQVAIGAAWYLTAAGIPVSVISLAGVLDSHPGLGRIGALWHLYGSKDTVQRNGALIFPGRWPVMAGSLWNRGLRSGKVSKRCLGEMTHAERGDYFDPHVADENGRTNRERTKAAIAGILLGRGRPAPEGD